MSRAGTVFGRAFRIYQRARGTLKEIVVDDPLTLTALKYICGNHTAQRVIFSFTSP